MEKRLTLLQIPAIETANVVGMFVFIVYAIVGFFGELPPHVDEKAVFYRIGYVLLSAVAAAFGAWLIVSVTFAVYNQLARRFGGLQVVIDVDNDDGEQEHLGNL